MMDQKLILIQQLKESKVSGNSGVGVSWEVRPQPFILWLHNYLVDCLLNNHILYEGRKREDEHYANQHTRETTAQQYLVSLLGWFFFEMKSPVTL
jgi:hypothetical protein